MLDRQGELILDAGVTLQDLKDVADSLQGHVSSLATTAETCLNSNGQHCQIDPKDQVSDYDYRIKLPVARGSFQEDLDLATSTEAVNRLPAELQHAKDLVFNYFRARGVRDVPPAWVDNDPNVVAKSNELAAAQAEFQHLTANRLSDIKAARLRQWIQTVSEQRCNISSRDPGCLTQSAIDELGTKLVVK